MTDRSALEVTGVTVRYGRTDGVVDASLTVGVDEVVALIGANGAGKSSLLKAVAGIERCSGGRIVVDGTDVTDVPAHRRVAHGVALVPEGRGVFRELTVAENLTLGSFLRHRPQQRDAVDADLALVFDLFPRLHERRPQVAGTLSGGEQQMLAIGRAVMTHPKLLVLDEPSLGLAPKVIDEIVRALQSVKASRGLSILVAEQNAVLGLGMADRGYVLQNGRVVLTGAADELAGHGELIDLYLGSSSNEAERKAA